MDYDVFCRWDSGCKFKVRFSHRSHANQRIKRLLHMGSGLDISSLVAYKCVFCGGFHFGHRRLPIGGPDQEETI